MRRRIVIPTAWVLFFFFQLTPTHAQTQSGQVEIHSQTVFYEITGLTAKALWDSIQQHGPQQSGGRYAAHTDVQNEWRFRFAPVADACVILEATVRTRITMQLPNWKPPRKADRELIQKWNSFLQALSLHEQGHADLGRDAANAIQKALMEVTTPSCTDINAAANTAAERVDLEFGERARKYDEETQYGRTQGAYWAW
jgi:predicted secreted Zn-dependent protease